LVDRILHTCVSTFVQKDHHQLEANFIASAILTLIMNNLSIMIASIRDEIKLHYKYKISYDKAWVAKQKVIEHLFGSYKELLRNFLGYCWQIKK
jgi:hypothetical protein